MNAMGYQSYEQYREETCYRMPKTVEAHQKKLTKTMATLYQQKDYRALEALLHLAEALADDSISIDRHADLYWLVADAPKATDSALRICRRIAVPVSKSRAYRKEKATQETV